MIVAPRSDEVGEAHEQIHDAGLASVPGAHPRLRSLHVRAGQDVRRQQRTLRHDDNLKAQCSEVA